MANDSHKYLEKSKWSEVVHLRKKKLRRRWNSTTASGGVSFCHQVGAVGVYTQKDVTSHMASEIAHAGVVG